MIFKTKKGEGLGVRFFILRFFPYKSTATAMAMITATPVVLTKVSEDTAFPFKIGAPCLVEIDEEKEQLVIKPILEREATELGWRKRVRRE